MYRLHAKPRITAIKARAFSQQPEQTPDPKQYIAHLMLAAALGFTVFQAGRIDGIRSARLRHPERNVLKSSNQDTPRPN
jgi:hypothetical protein